MDVFLQTVASNAVLATFVAVTVAAAIRFVRRPKVVYWLWMLVLIKLVTPPIVQVPLVLSSTAEPVADAERAVPPEERLIAWESGPAEVSEEGEPASAPDSISISGIAQPAGAGQTGLQVPWRGLVLLGWLTGSILWFALAAIRLLRFGQLVRHAESAPEYLQAAARRLAGRFGLRRAPEVRVLAGPVPPLLWWASRRTLIVLPVDLLDQLEPNAQEALLAHELAHYRRGDHLVRWAEVLILGLYWWHPVVWWARRGLHQAEEQCCDALVLWAFPGTAKSYADTLLTTVGFLSERRFLLPVAASGLRQFNHLKRRTEMIVGEQADRRMSWRGLLAVVTVALAILPWSVTTLPAQRTEEGAGSLKQTGTLGAHSPGESRPSEAKGAERSADAAPVSGLPPAVRRAKEAWAKRQNALHSVLYVMDVQETMELPRVTPMDPKSASPPKSAWRTLRIETQLRLSGDMMDYRSRPVGGDTQYSVAFSRSAYDGKESRRLYQGSKSTGNILDQAGCDDADRVGLRPLILAFRPFHPEMGAMSLDNFRVSAEGRVVDGIECVMLEELGDKKKKATVWVAPAQDYAMVRFVQRYKGRVGFSIDMTNTRDAEHGWIPSSWKVRSLRGDGSLSTSSEWRRVKYALNRPILRSEFQIAFPPGTRVEDRRTGELFLAREDGGRRVITRDERSAGATHEELLTTESGKAVPPGFLRILRRVRAIADAEPEEQQIILKELEEYLSAEGYQSRYLWLVFSAADRLHSSGRSKLAVEVCEKFAGSIPGHEQELSRLAHHAKKIEAESRRTSLPGDPIQVTGTTVDGKRFDWSVYRGKVVLIDFWFIGCRECMIELPNLKENYQLYRARGFEVVGISIDRDPEALKKFLKERQIPWVNLYQQGDDRQPTVKYYGVSSFPTRILVDREGKVVSLEAGGKELGRLLAELLGPARE